MFLIHLNCECMMMTLQAGQTCICANRIYVHEAVYDELASRLVERVRSSLIVGDGTERGVTCGPLINAAAVEKVSYRNIKFLFTFVVCCWL